MASCVKVVEVPKRVVWFISGKVSFYLVFTALLCTKYHSRIFVLRSTVQRDLVSKLFRDECAKALLYCAVNILPH